MQKELERRKEECENRQTTLQPCMFQVQVSAEGQSTYFSSFNQVFYKFSKCVKILDISTKLHQVLDLKYAHQSNQAYMFVQRCCFNINTKYDKVSPALSVLSKKCEQLQI
mgnify:CR=1 FL=1